MNSSIYISIAVIVVVIALYIVKIINDNKLLNAVTKKYRGTRAEQRLVIDLQKAGVPAHNIYHDLFLEYSDGCYSQIDVVVLLSFGLLVFEDKDYSGWLFGTGWQKYWTQILNYGREKHRFYNPIKQNENHIYHLRSVLLEENISVPIFSCIIFHGDCIIKSLTDIPDDVFVIYSSQLKKLLKSFNYTPYHYSDVDIIRSILQTAVQNGESEYVLQHHLHKISDIGYGN